MAAAPTPDPNQSAAPAPGGQDPSQDPSQGGGQDVPMPIRQCAALSTLAQQIAQALPQLAPQMQQITKLAQDSIRTIVLNSQSAQPQAPPY